ncbi:hypothetical protein A4R28_27395 [Mesorhizobium ciceri]|nr:hypothetical protein A4R28_27395 [Mesorhizobium ciceri]
MAIGAADVSADPSGSTSDETSNAKVPAPAGAFAIAAGFNQSAKKGPPPLGSGQVLECRGINPAWDQRADHRLVAGIGPVAFLWVDRHRA